MWWTQRRTDPGFLERDDCEYAYACDPELRHRANAKAKQIEELQGKPPKIVADFREALEDKSVDAIVSATPDHWHALSTVWACQAGKDVYVEKPPTHDCWEGQQMVKAARKYKRIVQCGFQNRSAPYNMAAKKYLEEGKLGTIHLCRIYNQKPPWGMCPQSARQRSAGRTSTGISGTARHPNIPTTPACTSAGITCGATAAAISPTMPVIRSTWHAGCWESNLPKTVYSTGGRFATDPETLVAETPDTQIALYDYDKLLVSFELTLFGNYMLKTDPVVRNNDMFPYWMQNSTRIEIFGTEGMMVVGRHGGGWQVFVRPKIASRSSKEQTFGRFPDPEHKENFVQSIRSRQLPIADVEQGHRSCLLIHYANISYRLGGQKLAIDADTQHIVDNADAMKLFRRTYREPWVIEDEV